MEPILSAYISRISSEQIENWLLGKLPGLEQTDILDLGNSDRMKFYESLKCKVTLQPTIGFGLKIIDLNIYGELDKTSLAGFNDIDFGKLIVDELSADVIVDCGGSINPSLSDWMVRITKKKVESILITEEDQPIDESCTKLEYLR